MFPANARVFAVTCLYLVLVAFEMTYPIAMGWITDTLHWNYAFLLDFPFLTCGSHPDLETGASGISLPAPHRRYVDKWGAVLLVVSLIALQVGTSRGERDMWLESPLIAGALVIAAVCFAGFLWLDSRADNPSPILHLRTVWREAELRTSLFLVMAVGAILGCGLFVLPQYLRYVQDYSATQTGEFIVDVYQRTGHWAGAYVAGDPAATWRTAHGRARFGAADRNVYNLSLYMDADHSRESARAGDLPAGICAGADSDCGVEYCDRTSGSPGSQRRVDHVLLCATTGEHVWGYGSDGYL